MSVVWVGVLGWGGGGGCCLVWLLSVGWCFLLVSPLFYDFGLNIGGIWPEFENRKLLSFACRCAKLM